MKSSVLLIRPAYSSTVYRLYAKLPRDRGIQPPLGLMYIASSLEASGYPVEILDAEIELLDNQQIFKRIGKFMPAYVGITSTTPESPRVRELFDMIKRGIPEIVTVAGGPHFTAVPEAENGAYDSIDYVVVGDGEKAFLKIVNEKPAEKVIKVEDDGDLDKLLLPARHLVDYSHYKFPMPGKGMMRMDMVLTARGCPFRCYFCFNRNTKVRYRNIEKCVDEIELSHQRYKTKFIMFLDDTLTISKHRTMQICDEMIRRRLHKKVVFYANVRADKVDFELLKKMRDAGVVEISMGVESGNQAMLDNINKGTRLEQYEKAYEWMRRLGLETRGSFIIGHPYETHETIHDTINFAKRIKLMRGSCCILTPYPGTEVYKGQVIGNNSRGDDISINVCKEKQQTNHRSSGEGTSEHFNSPKLMSLENAIEYIDDSELVEVTPKSIRIRKIDL